MERGNDSEKRTEEAVDGEFEDSPFEKWLAARAAEGIRRAAGR
ncbi:hypothetical protein [Streptomyces sp. NPDC051677]